MSGLPGTPPAMTLTEDRGKEMVGENQSWIVSQLGARENYSVARALLHAGHDCRLVTDAWSRAGWAGKALPGRLAQRRHPDIPDSAVIRFTRSSIFREAVMRMDGSSGWDAILRRNEWFQGRVVKALSELPGADERIVFSYSYTARRPFRAARKRGWMTILGQIDPGPGEERIVARLVEKHGATTTTWRPAPARYWEDWRREWHLADRLLVNSSWSRKLLLEEGVPADKIAVFPLVYTPPPEAAGFSRRWPASFSRGRPLRVLFLGQAILRKGIMELLEAARLMEREPVKFRIVGPREVEAASLPNVEWVEPVPRGDTASHYRWADVFLFPTHSDGFGLTQLEARAWRLPLVTTRCCGEVVQSGKNGLLIEEVTGECIAGALAGYLESPQQLAKHGHFPDLDGFRDLDALGTFLSELAAAQES